MIINFPLARESTPHADLKFGRWPEPQPRPMIETSKPKPGIKTTEFWGKTLLQLTIILNQIFKLGIELDNQTAMTIVGGLEAIYHVVRGVTKAGPKTINVTNTTLPPS